MSEALEAELVPAQKVSPEIIFHAAILGVAIAVILASCLLSVDGPSTVLLPWFDSPIPPTCGMRIYYGLDCPGCGLTRSFITLAHGDLWASLRFNPAGVLLFAALVFQIPYRVVQLFRTQRGLPTQKLMPLTVWFWASVGAVLLSQWIWKLGIQLTT